MLPHSLNQPLNCFAATTQLMQQCQRQHPNDQLTYKQTCALEMERAINLHKMEMQPPTLQRHNMA